MRGDDGDRRAGLPKQRACGREPHFERLHPDAGARFAIGEINGREADDRPYTILQRQGHVAHLQVCRLGDEVLDE